MATTEKIRKDIEKTREKIAEQQKRLRALEAQLTEEENLEIVRMVKAVRMDNRELTAFLRAYASGMISLPDGLMESEESEGTEDAVLQSFSPFRRRIPGAFLHGGHLHRGLRRWRGRRALLHRGGDHGRL